MTALLETWLPWLTSQLTRGRRPEPRQRIYCANHASHLDAVLVMAALPADARRRTRPVAAADYWAKNAWRRFCTLGLLRAVLVDRQAPGLNPLSDVFSALHQGDSLIYFPEGTRGSGQQIQPLKPGVYYLARAFPHVDIVPVHIQGAHRLLPKGATLPRPVPCPVTIGEPLRWEGEDQVAFLARLRAAMAQLA